MILNRTPYAVERTWVQDKDANKIWLVVVKATFAVLPDGSTRLAETQLPVLRMPTHLARPGDSSLVYESDLLGVKPGTDVLVNGRAWGPPRSRTFSVDVQIAVGPIRKRLRVFGDRTWERRLVGGITRSDPQPFESMPIHYERAFGGWDRTATDPADHRFEPRNPVGTGFAIRSDHCPGLRLPNVEYPDQLIDSWKQNPRPASLTAVECHWSPRRELAGTYDAKWRLERLPLWAEDFDQRYHHCAPTDQQVPGFLRGGEMVELIHLSPAGRLVFTLPRRYPFFRTRFGSERVEHRAQLCTVIMEPDVPRVIMVWQTSLLCNQRVDELDETVVLEKRVI
jgi:hypothetical protein